MAKVVIDANVIISAAFGGKPLEALAWAMRDHEVYLSPSIEKELKETMLSLSKKLLADKMAYLHEKIEQLMRLARSVSPSVNIALSRDPKDNHYLALCKEVKADYLVTGDKDLLAISKEVLEKNGIRCAILSPDEFLEQSL
ncbi:MAG: putative toxin-antitoxin system toxin component, PIN family [Candidatus Aminicenantes bacterium]|nr:putative toxin-antitoxin system toxin component, PIN family [Candidatus Aminicenantes bacterium]